MIDEKGQFYLVDFGLSDITKTLSQARDLEIFAKEFAAPEKLNKLIPKGFAYQSDIYSIAKVVDWFYAEKQDEIEESLTLELQKLLAENPVDRPGWDSVTKLFERFVKETEQGKIYIEFKNGFNLQVFEALTTSTPRFDISTNEARNPDFIFVNVLANDFVCEGAFWIKSQKKLVLSAIKSIRDFEPNVQDIKRRESVALPVKYNFTINITSDNIDITTILVKWFRQKQTKFRLKEAAKTELSFYEELLKQEKEVIKNKSLRLQYSNFNVKGHDIEFRIKENEKCSTTGFVMSHVDEGNAVLSEGFEYTVSASGDKKQNKNTVEFAGKPFEFKDGWFRIKDCDRLNRDIIPHSGYLFENTAKKEEEKNRQLDAIRKVNKNEVQNPDLIYYLFKPDALKSEMIDYESEQIESFQKDTHGVPFEYSYNQRKAIVNALKRTPLSVIQGPPGTGKTTVITEIVFQLLKQKPEARILITSQTNNAVDQVLENLINNKIPVLRLSGITPPRNPLIRKHTINNKLEGWKAQVLQAAQNSYNKEKQKFFSGLTQGGSESLIKLIVESTDWPTLKQEIEKRTSHFHSLKALANLPADKKEAILLIGKTLEVELNSFMELTELHKDWISTVNALDEKSAINQKLIDSVRVIGATCNHTASKNYNKFNFEFDYVIMDESGKATPAEALVPIVMGNNLVFVGDHRQLRPMLTTTREVESWLRERCKKEADELENWDDYFNRPSLFERIITSVEFDYKSQLTECRRSSSQQVILTSACFYEPEGDEAIEPVERESDQEHNLPLAINSSVIFIDTGSEYKNEFDDKSSKNKVSARIIPQVLLALNKYNRVKDYSIGVITGYTAQLHLLKRTIDKMLYESKPENITRWKKTEEKLTISVVDRFQGLERDIVIVDLVKSGPGLKLGFLEVPNRVNVALSRQKKLLIIVGDYHSIVNAVTSPRLKGEKAALQKYLEKIKPEWRIHHSEINQLFV